MTKFLAIAGLAAVLGACAASPVPSAAEAGLIVPPDDNIPVHGATGVAECRNDGLDQFKGRTATSEVGAEMLRVSGARTIRWARPGTMMTMEFSPERLTVHIDPANRITRAICG